MVVQPWHRLDFDHGPAAWVTADGPTTLGAVRRAVVLELKSTLDVPRWMARLTERLALRRVGVSKYCNGVDRVWGEAALRHGLSLAAGGDL